MNVNMNMNKKNSLSIDYGSSKQLKREIYSFNGLGDRSANKAFQSEGKNNIAFLEFGDEEKIVQNDRKFYPMSSRNLNNNEGFNHNFFEQEKSKNFSEKFQIPAFLKQQNTVNKMNSFEPKQKHSVSFFEPKYENQNKIIQKLNEEPHKYSYKILQKNKDSKSECMHNSK